MPGQSDVRVLLRLVLLSCVMLFTPLQLAAQGIAQEHAKEQAQRQQDQPLNNAPVWRDVRSSETPPYQTTQVRGVETNVLVQSEGEIWRQVRNGPITIYGGWLLVIVAAVIGLYYWRMGPLKLHKRPTGRLVERFSGWERTVHWLTAISFVVLAASGLVILFGKYVLLPMFGYTLFSWLAVLCKNLHNFLGPVFAVGTVLMFFTFVKDNLPKAYDWIWVIKLGGFFGAREHVPSGRFNAGEKSWFWIGVTLLGIVSAVTGFIMLFPNFEQGRGLMQLANVIHGVSAMIFIAMALGHIYVGTIGVEKAYETMRTGMADEIWAQEHHEYWYHEVVKGRPGAAGTLSAARAGAMKEGWKL